MLAISEYEHDTWALLCPHGTLDASTIDLLSHTLQRYLGRKTTVFVHCKRLLLPNLRALHLLTDTTTRARDTGTDVRLIGLHLAADRHPDRPDRYHAFPAHLPQPAPSRLTPTPDTRNKINHYPDHPSAMLARADPHADLHEPKDQPHR